MAIEIKFEITKNGHTLRDTLILPEDHEFTTKQIDAMKNARFDAWYQIIMTPVENPNPEIFVEGENGE